MHKRKLPHYKWRIAKTALTINWRQHIIMPYWKSLYHIERCVDETGESINDGSHIIYVNGKYKGDDPIGKLVSDFRQTDADKMNYKEMADSVRHFKEEEGCENMCEAVEQYGDRRAERATERAVKKLMENMKWTLEQALNALGIQGDERDTIAKSIMGQ